jgi:hypothetical protein
LRKLSDIRRLLLAKNVRLNDMQEARKTA